MIRKNNLFCRILLTIILINDIISIYFFVVKIYFQGGIFMRFPNSDTLKIIEKNHIKFRNADERKFLVELSCEFYADKFCMETIQFSKRLASYLQHMIEQEGKKIADVLDDAVDTCDFYDYVTLEHRRLAIKLLNRIWIYGDELETSTNPDGTTKIN